MHGCRPHLLAVSYLELLFLKRRMHILCMCMMLPVRGMPIEHRDRCTSILTLCVDGAIDTGTGEPMAIGVTGDARFPLGIDGILRIDRVWFILAELFQRIDEGEVLPFSPHSCLKRRRSFKAAIQRFMWLTRENRSRHGRNETVCRRWRSHRRPNQKLSYM